MIVAAQVPAVPPPVVVRVPGGELSAPAVLTGAPGPVPADLAGWEARGAVAPVPVVLSDGRPAVRLTGNTTLLTPPVTVPAGAQTLEVAVASRAGALVDVVAEPVDGGPAVPLGTVAPGAAGAQLRVAAGAAAGRTVRIALDPTTAFGGSVDVAGVGPFAAPLPGWLILGGVPHPAPGRMLRVDEDPLRLRAPAVRFGPDVRYVRVAVRGSGRVVLRAGGRSATRVAAARWADVRLRVVPGRPAVLEVRAAPGAGRLELRDLGLTVRQVRLGAVRADGGPGRRLVTATAAGPAAGLPVAVTDRGRVVGRGRVTAAGRIRVVARPRGGARVLVVAVAGDRGRLGARAVVRLGATTR